LGGPDAVGGLIFALGDDFPSVSRVAAMCLGDIGSEEAYQGVIDALPELEGRSSEAAARSLFRMRGQLALPHLLKVLPYWRMNKEGVRRTLKRLNRDELVPAIIDCVNGSDSEEREGAVIALGLLGGTEAHRTIIGCLSDADPFVVAAAAEGLGELKDTDFVHLLLAALSHQDGVVRRSAVDSLGEIGDGRAFEPLARLIEDERNKTVLFRAKQVLRRLAK